jgi:hypothetical protein
MPQVTGQAIGIVHDCRRDRLAIHQVAQRPQPWAVHGRAGEALINQDVALRHGIAFALGKLLAGLELGGNGEAFTLVFGRHSGIECCILVTVHRQHVRSSPRHLSGPL